MNTEQARFNMVEQQIRPWNVLDQRVLDLMSRTPRESFVPPGYENLAFSDTSIPLGFGQVMMSPKLEARVLQALAVREADVSLEIGTGSGYLTALLAYSCRRVVSVEFHAPLSEQAQRNLLNQDIGNTSLHVGDAIQGWPTQAPYDVIAVTGSLYRLQQALLDQLRVGGRLFAIVGEDPVMEARLVTRVSDAEWATETLFETSLPALIGGEPPKRFIL